MVFGFFKRKREEQEKVIKDLANQAKEEGGLEHQENMLISRLSTELVKVQRNDIMRKSSEELLKEIINSNHMKEKRKKLIDLRKAISNSFTFDRLPHIIKVLIKHLERNFSLQEITLRAIKKDVKLATQP